MSETGVVEIESVQLIEQGLMVTFQNGLVALFPETLLAELVQGRMAGAEGRPHAAVKRLQGRGDGTY